MRLLFYIIISVFFILSCENLSWDLEFDDIKTTNRNIASSNIDNEFEFVPSFTVPFQDSLMLSCGNSDNGNIFMKLYSLDGTSDIEHDNIVNGSPKALEVNKELAYIINQKLNTSSLIIYEPESEILISETDFFDAINSDLGLLDSLILNDVKVDDNNIFICGSLKQTIGERKGIIIQSDLLGTLIKFKTFNEGQFFDSMDLHPNGDISLSGHSNQSAILARLDMDFTLQWLNRVGEIGEDLWTDCAVYQNDSLIMVYVTSNFGLEDQVVVKIFDREGIELSSIPFGAFGAAQSLVDIDLDNNIIVGSTVNRQGQNPQIQLYKINGSTFEPIFIRNYESQANISTAGLGHTQDCGYFYSGIFESNQGGIFQYIKTDFVGEIR